MSIDHAGRIAASLAALAAAGLIDGCDVFGPSDRVAVRLPEPPPHWQRAFPRLSFELEYPGPGGELCVAGPFAWGERVTVSCSKEANGAFLAWPLAGEERRRFLRPAGGLYPLDVERAHGEDELCLTWADGCLAVVMLRLAVAGRNPALVNTARLAGCLAAEPDPWSWDLTRIEERLAGGGFTGRDIERLPTTDAVVQPGEGEWFLETPFGGLQAAAPDGALELPGLSHGLHTLFGMDGRRIRLFADSRGVFTLPMENAPAGVRRTSGRSRRAAA
jgi:hypothetical protein